MNPPTRTPSAPPTPRDYGPLPGCYDEMVDRDGTPRAHWADLAESLQELGVEELLRRQAEAARLLDQDGVVYNAYREEERADQRWLLDPLPAVLSSREWEGIESGVIERAELLNLVLDDLYGPRDLLRRGVLPAEVVFGHAGFLRACDGIRLPGEQQLFSYAADIGRDADGRYVALSDRTQAPSGAGYALENRTVISRVLPSLYRDAQVHRLAPFFRSLRVALQAVAPPGVDDPRIVVLTPGPWNETAFEHALVASTLGYPLVEGSDLTVRRDGVWMRALGRLEPVHVILRRVDAWFCDPLELQGRLAARDAGARRGGAPRGGVGRQHARVQRAREPGAAGVPARASASTCVGAAPRLPGVPTWWCGDPGALRHVLEHLDELVVRPMSRAPGTASTFGWELSAGELDDLRRRDRASAGRVGRAGADRDREHADADGDRPDAAPQRAARVRRGAQRLLRRHAGRAHAGRAGRRPWPDLQPGRRDQQGHLGAGLRARAPDRLLAALGPGRRGHRPDVLDPVARRREPLVARALRGARGGRRPACCARSTTAATTSRLGERGRRRGPARAARRADGRHRELPRLRRRGRRGADRRARRGAARAGRRRASGPARSRTRCARCWTAPTPCATSSRATRGSSSARWTA